MKKFFASTLAVLLLFLGVAALPAAAVTFTPPFDPNADAVYLVNLDTGIVVYQKNADKKRAPQRTLLIASLFQPWVQPTRPTFFSSRMRSEIMAMNSEFVGLPRRLWMV